MNITSVQVEKNITVAKQKVITKDTKISIAVGKAGATLMAVGRME